MKSKMMKNQKIKMIIKNNKRAKIAIMKQKNNQISQLMTKYKNNKTYHKMKNNTILIKDTMKNFVKN